MVKLSKPVNLVKATSAVRQVNTRRSIRQARAVRLATMADVWVSFDGLTSMDRPAMRRFLAHCPLG